MCERALEFGGPEPYRLLVRGEMYFFLGNLKKAIECYDASLQMKPRFADTHYARGIALYRAGFPKRLSRTFY